MNFSSWVDILELNAEADDTEMFYLFTNVDPYTFYEFRIRISRLDDGKPVAGIPGPKAIPPIRPLEECIGIVTPLYTNPLTYLNMK
jgi:hypothetical protein